MYLIKNLFYMPTNKIGIEVYNRNKEFIGFLFYKYDGFYYRVGTAKRYSLDSLKWVLENKECIVICTSDMFIGINSVE